MAVTVTLNPEWFSRFRNQVQFQMDELSEKILDTAVSTAPSSQARTATEALVAEGKRKPLRAFVKYRRGAHTLAKSGKVIAAKIEGDRVTGGVVFTAPYAIYVHVGATGARKSGQPNPWLSNALHSHAGEIQDGSFIKGNR